MATRSQSFSDQCLCSEFKSISESCWLCFYFVILALRPMTCEREHFAFSLFSYLRTSFVWAYSEAIQHSFVDLDRESRWCWLIWTLGSWGLSWICLLDLRFNFRLDWRAAVCKIFLEVLSKGASLRLSWLINLLPSDGSIERYLMFLLWKIIGKFPLVSWGDRALW